MKHFGVLCAAIGSLWAWEINDAAPAYALTCFKTGEQSAGMNKICYYNCLGSTAAITISAVALCPLTIER